MRRTVRRPGAIALLAALVAVPTGLPAAAQSGSASQVTQRQSILTELGSTGEVSSSRVFTQLTVAGDGETSITLPQQSTRGLRSLDGFRGPEVAGDDVIWNVSATPEGTRGRTVADNTAELPVDVQVAYSLDGRQVDADDLVGSSGRLSVTYTITNLTAEPVEIRPSDARGEHVTETVDIAVPMVGSLALTLPPNFTGVDARGSNVVGDGRGNTVVNASLLLFAPLGDETQEVTIHADVTDAVMPGARIQVLPVDEASFGSLRSTSLAYREATDGTQRLGYGAQLIDTNVLKLADGAAQLLDGLTQLADGAGELSDGLSNTAAPGAQQLADGTGQARSGAAQLATGLGELSLGANRLREGLSQADGGAGALAAGLGDLAAGAVQVRDGLGSARAGSRELSGGLAQLAAGAGDLSDGAGALAGGTSQVADGAEQLAAGSPDLKEGADDLAAGLSQLAAGTGAFPDAIEGLAALADGLTQLRAGVGDADDPTTLYGGLFALDAQVSGAGDAPALDDAVAQLYAGSQLIQAGIGQLRGAFSNTSCDLANAGNPANPCGVLQFANAAAATADGVAANLVALGGNLDGIIGTIDEGETTLIEQLEDVSDGIGGLVAGAEQARDLAGGAAQVATTATGSIDGGLAPGMADLVDGLEQLDQSAPALVAGIRSLRDGAAAASAALAQLEPGAVQLAEGLIPGLTALGDAAGPLVAGSQALAAGATRIDGGLQALAPGARAAADGASQVAGGAGQLAAGAQAAASGSRELDAGVGQLEDGSVALAAGARTAAAGSRDLRSGVGQLEDGSVALAAGAGQAAGGGRDLASGLIQIDDGASQLADGLGDAADGSTQLADGLTQAEDGGTQVADGSVALSEQGMSALIDGISDAKLGASRNLETIKAVSERGRRFEGPYGTAARADSSTVWQFEVAGVGDVDGSPSTGMVALLALLALGIAGGVGTVLRRRIV